jgi:transcriptional regulator with XRE-family HTH domain
VSDLGQRVRELRLKRGLSLSELAGAAGVDYNNLSKIEKDRTPGAVSIRTLGQLAQALNVDAMEFLSLANRASQPFTSSARGEEAMQVVRQAAEQIDDNDGWREMSELLDGIIARRRAT